MLSSGIYTNGGFDFNFYDAQGTASEANKSLADWHISTLAHYQTAQRSTPLYSATSSLTYAKSLRELRSMRAR